MSALAAAPSFHFLKDRTKQIPGCIHLTKPGRRERERKNKKMIPTEGNSNHGELMFRENMQISSGRTLLKKFSIWPRLREARSYAAVKQPDALLP